MRIDTPSDPICVEHSTTLVVGQPGSGKTTMGYTAGLVVALLNFDLGAHRATGRRGNTHTFDGFEDVQAHFTRRLVRERGYTTVVIDTVERLLQLITTQVLERDPKAGSRGLLNQRGWGMVKLLFTSWINDLRSWQVDVVLLAHAKERRVLAPRGSAERDEVLIKPDIPGGSLDEALKIADFCGYLHMVGTERVIDFTSTGGFHGKGPLGVVPVPAIDESPLFLHELVVRGRQALKDRSTAGADVAGQQAAFDERLRSRQDAAHFNALVAVVRALETDAPKMVHVHARAHLKAAAAAAGMRWDFAQDAYIDTGVRPPAARPAPVPSAVASRVNRAATWQPQLLSRLTEGGDAVTGPGRVHSPAPAAGPAFSEWGR